MGDASQPGTSIIFQLPTTHRLRSPGIETCHTTKYRTGLATTCGRLKYGLRPLGTEWDRFTDGKTQKKRKLIISLLPIAREAVFCSLIAKSYLSRLIRKGPLARRASFRKTGNQTHVLQSFSECVATDKEWRKSGMEGLLTRFFAFCWRQTLFCFDEKISFRIKKKKKYRKVVYKIRG